MDGTAHRPKGAVLADPPAETRFQQARDVLAPPSGVSGAERAAALPDRAGYGDRVSVVQADVEHPVPDFGPFDRILVTAGAWDIPRPDQLIDDGVLVMPLRMNGVTRTIAFHRDGDHLASGDVEVAGFVPMQGDDAHEDIAHEDMRSGRSCCRTAAAGACSCSSTPPLRRRCTCSTAR